MKVTGFTFVRNAVKYDYPVVESIQSILPICDEFIVAIGKSDDSTVELIQSINNPKIKIIHTVWDDTLREGGKVLAKETDKALNAVSADTDWCFYLQADEVIHEKYLPTLKKAMTEHISNPKVDGLLCKYLHFYGSYNYIGDAHRWYRREIRIFKKKTNVYSYRDAQGFRKDDNKKLHVKLIDAYVYHYGWVKPPEKQKEKLRHSLKFWNNDDIDYSSNFDYSQIDSLKSFKDTHPAVMLSKINRMDWNFNFDIQQKKLSIKDKFKIFIEKVTGLRIWEYRNYRLIK